MKKSAQPKVDFSTLRNKLKLKNIEFRNQLSNKHLHVQNVLLQSSLDIGGLRQKSGKLLSAGAAASTLLLSPSAPVQSLPPPHELIERLKQEHAVVPLVSPQKILTESLQKVLPRSVRPLNRNEEKVLERIFSDVVGINAKATLEGEHLNTTYGLIGIEQHLLRFPGDSLAQQAKDTDPKLLREGMAPGKGAWGYFASSKAELTPDLIETEKWYAVVQTLYLPDWNIRTRYLRDWYKYRKVLIVNTVNGNAVVASIADSGPAAWTGKVFGGSPEVMNSLGGARYTKGSVVVFFVDDPNNTIPLGPVEYNKIQVPQWAFQPI